MLAVAQGCGGHGPRPQGVRVAFIATPESATRMRLSPSNRFVAVEIDDERALPDPTKPKRIEVVSLSDGAVRSRGEGWLVGAPTDDGDQLIAERVASGLTLRWLVRGARLEVALPPGDWRWLDAVSASGADRAYVVFARRGDPTGSSLWIGAVDREPMTLAATTTLDAPPMHHGAPLGQCAAAAARTTFFLVCGAGSDGAGTDGAGQDAEALDLRAFDASLAPLWRGSAQVPAEVGSGDVLAEVTGDGAHLVVAHGSIHSNRILRLRSLVAVDVRTGAPRVVPAISSPVSSDVRSLAPVPGAPEVAMLHLYDPPAHAMFATHRGFSGVSVFDARGGVVHRTYETGRAELGEHWREVHDLYPQAFAVRTDGVVVVGRRR